MSGETEHKHRSLSDRFKGLKVKLIHKKHQIGKLGNLFNPAHRHDEEHEKQTDAKRTAICKSHRYESYFPEQEGNDIKWYVDGRDYFWAVSMALETARETIYIADWWLSPELYLRRPPSENEKWRLDNVLKRRAEAGVKIYVIVYREVEAALSCNSAHTKDALTGLCPKGTKGYGNIHVMRHPDHNFFENAGDMTFYWAHHEKFIVIDYQMAFIGGLDLCFGRWDNRTHPLSDMHPGAVQKETWPGQDFNNSRVADFKNVNDWNQNEIKKDEAGRMPWHDVAMALTGPCIYDIGEHFVGRWNFIKRDKYKHDKRFDWLTLRGREGKDEDLVSVQRPLHPMGEYVLHPLTPLESKPELKPNRGTLKAQLVRSADDWSNGTLLEHSIQNAYIELIRNAQHYVYIENQFFITATGDKQGPVKNLIGRAMVDAIVNNAKKGNTKFKIIIVIPAVPAFAGDLRDDAALGTRAIMDYQYKSICRGPDSIFEQIRSQGVDPSEHIFFFNLRSYDRLPNTEKAQAIEKESGVTYNQASHAQGEAVAGEAVHGAKDHEAKEEGQRTEYEEEAAETKRQYEEGRQKAAAEDHANGVNGVNGVDGAASSSAVATTNGTKTNGVPTTNGATPPSGDVAPSVAFHSYLNQGKVSEEPWEGDPKEEIQNWIQEELYIHAKLLIVDDRYVCCGSSNLNDRSQLGAHDSELSIVMEDTRLIESTMGGQPYQAGYHATTLRRFLWREHLGLLAPQDNDGSNDPNAHPPGTPNDVRDKDPSWKFVEDPLSDDVWKMWTEQATVNTDTFRHLFHADPDDYVKTFEDYTRYMPSKGVKAGHIFDQFIPPEDVRSKLDLIKGHLVWHQLDFLKDAEMAEYGLQKNALTESVYA